jgi:hypothetical protein
MFAAFMRLLMFLGAFLPSGVFGWPQVRPALPPSAARVLRAPFWSGPTHVV